MNASSLLMALNYCMKEAEITPVLSDYWIVNSNPLDYLLLI